MSFESLFNTEKHILSMGSVFELLRRSPEVVLDEHIFHLLWNSDDSKYTHKFLDIILSCEYAVEKDFTAVIKKQGLDLPPIKVNRKKSGRPESLR